MSIESQHRYTIELLSVAMDIIDLMKEGEADVYGISEVARRLGINRNRAFRILKTLEERGYVEFEPQTQGYRLGIQFLSIGERVRDRLDVRREAESVMIELARLTGDTVHLLMLFGQNAVCVDHYMGENVIQVTDTVGAPIPLYLGASPKVLLANLPLEQAEQIISQLELRPLTPKTVTDKDELRKVLQTIRKQEYAVDEGEMQEGVYAVGAPVYDRKGKVVAGLTITTSEARCTPDRKRQLIELDIQAARKISRKLGYRPPISVENLFTTNQENKP